MIKKIEAKLEYPMTVKTTGGTGIAPAAVTAKNRKELEAGLTEVAAPDRKLVVEQVSCKFTRENFEAKPNLQATEAQGAEAEEEFCENCGRVMVLRNGPFGQFMACPGYSEDPPCKTIRKLTHKQQQKPAVPLDETCPEMRYAIGIANRAIWRVCQLQRLSEMQVHQAEPDRREMPDLRHWRHCRAQGAAWKFLLRMHELSEVRFHVELEANPAGVSGVWQPISTGEVS